MLVVQLMLVQILGAVEAKRGLNIGNFINNQKPNIILRSKDVEVIISYHSC